MIRLILSGLKNLTGIIKNLNLTKEQAIIAICLTILAGSIWSVTHYKDKANGYKSDLVKAKIELNEAKENAKIDSNIKEMAELQRQNDEKDMEILSLFKKLEKLRSVEITRTEIMEDLGEINNTEDACRAFAKSGYPICDY